MKTRIFRLQQGKYMPGHLPGDMLYGSGEGNYSWITAPHYLLEFAQIINHSDYFTEFEYNWEVGEPIFIIGANGVVHEQEFDPVQHSMLLVFGNAFKTKEQASTIIGKVSQLLKDDIALISEADIILLNSYLTSGEIEKAKQIINNLL